MRDSIRSGAILALALLSCLGCPTLDPDCQRDTDCNIGSVCEDGNCEQVSCLAVYDPVCGVDGKTYGNDCEARVAHVEVAHRGECGQICAGIAGFPCAEGEFCDLTPGQCDVTDASGVCVRIADFCTEEYDPVCGCDGNTYSNDCHRQLAMVQKDHEGECTAP